MEPIKHLLFLTLSLSFMIPAALGQSQDTETNGLVAFYTFNGTLADQSGSGNSAALIGFDGSYGPDRFNHAASLYLNMTSAPSPELDGTYVIAPRSAALNVNSDFTWSTWVNVSDRVPPAYTNSLISNGTDNSANLRLVSSSSASGADYLQFAGSPLSGVQALVPPLRNTWWQAVIVRAGTNLTLYRNGIPLASSSVSGSSVNSSAILIGKYSCVSPGCPTYSLVGGIDDLRMYNRALSALEVKQLYLFEANSLPFLTIAVKTIRLQLFLAPGTTNQLFSSTNLLTWTPYGVPFAATNSLMVQDVDVGDVPQFFQVRLQLGLPPGTLTLTNQANQLSSDPLSVVAYLNNSGTPIVVGSRSGNWNPQETWTMSLAGLTIGQSYTFELQDTAFSNAVFPSRSNPLVIDAGAPLSGFIYNTGSGGYFGWYIQWGWGP